MTLVTEMPNPKTSTDYIFAIVQLVAALLLFATIMGHVSYIVSNLGNARKEFQSKLDAVKTYMSLRRVPQRLQDRVIRWFDFLWTNHKSIDDNQVLNLLPYKLRAEIAIHVHLDTLKRVEIFQNTEAGFLNELVLRLKPVLYSPGDFICRKGEVGKEMYIVNGGKLHVISDNGKIVLATLKAGSYFGEISILNMGNLFG
jgi:cyclic nucleotide gated channel alpha 3